MLHSSFQPSNFFLESAILENFSVKSASNTKKNKNIKEKKPGSIFCWAHFYLELIFKISILSLRKKKIFSMIKFIILIKVNGY